MEHDGRVHVADAFDDRAVGVDPHEVVGGDLVPEPPETRHDERSALTVAHADVSGELVVVALAREGATGHRQLLALRERHSVELDHGQLLRSGSMPYRRHGVRHMTSARVWGSKPACASKTATPSGHFASRCGKSDDHAT